MAESEHAYQIMTVAFVMGASAYLVLMAGKILSALIYATRENRNESILLERGSLTVTQAIRSGDPGLSAMLESNLLSLSGQVFFWLCDEDDELAIRITSDLRDRYAGEDIRVILSPPCPEGKNPKVFKLIGVMPEVSTAYFLVLDDDTHLPAATAAALVGNTAEGGIATGLPQYSNSGSLASRLLAQFVNNNSVMTYLSLLPVANPISINGMCYVLRSEDIGVFPQIESHLTDDLAVATLLKSRGGKIYQSSQSQIISSQLEGMSHYFRMMHRWHLFALLLLKQQSAGYRLVIFALHGWHPLMFGALFLSVLIDPSVRMIGLLIGFLIVRGALISLLQALVFRKWLHRPLISVVSELLQPLHLVHALVSRKVDWRGRKYRVFASDRFESYE